MDQKQIDQLTDTIAQADAKRAEVVTAGLALLAEIAAWEALKCKAVHLLDNGWQSPSEDRIANRVYTLKREFGQVGGAFEKTLQTFCEIHAR